MSSIGLPGILLLIILALLLFGPKKLPELGRAIGRTFKEFKEGAQGMVNDNDPNQSTQSTVVNSSSTSNGTATNGTTTGAVTTQPVKMENNQRLPE